MCSLGKSQPQNWDQDRGVPPTACKLEASNSQRTSLGCPSTYPPTDPWVHIDTTPVGDRCKTIPPSRRGYSLRSPSSFGPQLVHRTGVGSKPWGLDLTPMKVLFEEIRNSPTPQFYHSFLPCLSLSASRSSLPPCCKVKCCVTWGYRVCFHRAKWKLSDWQPELPGKLWMAIAGVSRAAEVCPPVTFTINALVPGCLADEEHPQTKWTTKKIRVCGPGIQTMNQAPVRDKIRSVVWSPPIPTWNPYRVVINGNLMANIQKNLMDAVLGILTL